MKTLKYTYNKVIQQNYGQGWEDASEYLTDSTYFPKEYTKTLNEDGSLKTIISNISLDLREYKLLGYPTRVIKRKTLNELA